MHKKTLIIKAKNRLGVQLMLLMQLRRKFSRSYFPERRLRKN